jgi:hypothetical protein
MDDTRRLRAGGIFPWGTEIFGGMWDTDRFYRTRAEAILEIVAITTRGCFPSRKPNYNMSQVDGSRREPSSSQSAPSCCGPRKRSGSSAESQKASAPFGQGRIAEYLTRMDFVVLDELGYLPFSQAGGNALPPDERALRAHLDHYHHQSGLWRMAERLRRRQDDDGAPRPPDPSLRNHRNRQRELAFQKPRLSATPACPGGQTGTSRAGRFVAREGTARRARGPPVRYRDKPDPTPQRGPFCMPIRGAFCVPIDSHSGPHGIGPVLASTTLVVEFLGRSAVSGWGS